MSFLGIETRRAAYVALVVLTVLWGANWVVMKLALASAQLDTFPLSGDPVLGTLVVTVNGQVLTDGWIYDEESNSVVFTDPKLIPGAGDQIDVTYGGAAPCDGSGD